MMELTIPFSDQDEQDLREFKAETTPSEDSGPLHRQVISLPAIEAGVESDREEVEKALEDGTPFTKSSSVKLPTQLVENAKATFISSGGNISEVAALYDLTPEAVLRLASKENWPVYGGSTKVNESMSKAQLKALQGKLWHKIENMLDAMDVEKKAKRSITQHRSLSEYIEPLTARSSAFKVLMDQYMRVSTLLEPELFAADSDGSNFNARKAREGSYPGGIEGVNREIADFFSDVVVGIADRMKDREMEGYGQIIDARAE